jgi:IPT/TIG domain
MVLRRSLFSGAFICWSTLTKAARRRTLTIGLVVVAALAGTRSFVNAQLQAGLIDGIAPAAARANELVTITGHGFGAFNVRVLIAGVAAQVVRTDSGHVTFRVPVGLQPGPATVTARRVELRETPSASFAHCIGCCYSPFAMSTGV